MRSAAPVTISAERSTPRAASSSTTALVEGFPPSLASPSPVTTRSRSSCAREESTERIARRRMRFGSFCA